jgi:hypothetical protein
LVRGQPATSATKAVVMGRYEITASYDLTAEYTSPAYVTIGIWRYHRKRNHPRATTSLASRRARSNCVNRKRWKRRVNSQVSTRRSLSTVNRLWPCRPQRSQVHSSSPCYLLLRSRIGHKHHAESLSGVGRRPTGASAVRVPTCSHILGIDRNVLAPDES